MLTVLLMIFAGLGGLLIWRGYLGKRCGHEPRCLRCDYDLRGQIEPRCPECGTSFSEATVRRGRRRRHPWRIATGWLFISLAGTLTAPPVRQYLSTTFSLPLLEQRITWAWQREHSHYLPTPILTLGLRSHDPDVRRRSAYELRLRMMTGELSRDQLAKLAPRLLAALATKGRRPVYHVVGRQYALEETPAELLEAGIIPWSEAQKYLGSWAVPKYSRIWAREPDNSIVQRFALPNTSYARPSLLPITEVWLLGVDRPLHDPKLLESRGTWSVVHFLSSDMAPKRELTIRVSTTWYSFTGAAPVYERASGVESRAFLEAHKPPILHRVVKDVRLHRQTPPTAGWNEERWLATILAEGEDSATMPAP